VCQACRARRVETLITRQLSTSRARLDRLNVASLLAKDNEVEDVTVNGWVRSVRKQKKIAFAAVGDGSTIDSVQAVLKPEDAATSVCQASADEQMLTDD
jgi:asparaginyl-tRNA synthetase